MPQGRIVLKVICQSKKLADLKTDGARLLYTWLMPNVDINGCFSGDPRVINGQVFTRLKKTEKTIETYLEDLVSVGLVVWYEANGDLFLQIPDFVDRQPSLNPDKEAESAIPPPTPEQLQGNSRLTPRKVKQSKVKSKQSKDNYSPNSNEFALSDLLLKLILGRKPDFKKPNLQMWAAHIDKMIRLDNRKPARIREIIQWCQVDDFWQNNILSTAKLRKQFDKLELRAQSERKATTEGKLGASSSTGRKPQTPRKNRDYGHQESGCGDSVDTSN